MPRCFGLVAEGLIYHEINRGNNRQAVFRKAADFQAFLDALSDLQERKPFESTVVMRLANILDLE